MQALFLVKKLDTSKTVMMVLPWGNFEYEIQGYITACGLCLQYCKQQPLL